MAVSFPTIFSDIDKARSQKERKELLLKYETPPLLEVLKYTFHPDIKFLLPAGDPPYKTEVDDIQNPTYLYGLTRKLYLFVEGGNDNLKQTRREYLFIELLESVHEEEAKLLIQIKDKKIKCRGLTYKLIKETFPNLLP
mgnify:CR=1 FL=1|jgi:hypothetical protein|tara:strand:+ start:338 stop:754 length:417 start_codon:yes stop_codon:yes gene_type:complete